MRIVPLGQGFGAEVDGFDLARAGDGADIARLQAAWRRHHLLIFRAAHVIAPERQVEVAGWFGPVLCEDGAWTVLDNAEAAGRVVLPFHSDITFCPAPLEGISLCPLALPQGPTSTSFVDNAQAWRLLPAALKARLEGRKARHSFSSDGEIDLGLASFEHWHPACLTHPETGEKLLFVTEHHVDLIEGLSPGESAEVLRGCFAELYAPARRYEHVWRAGDLVIWDNLAVQHARTAPAEPACGRRIVRRVQLGRKGFLAQRAELREQAV
ncbi:MAG: TauD/TfdA family dioxygenase [Sphingomonadales bacterium]|nr:TauD/TfdA family dioxygenase [Sphingomonadales bacterium]